MTIYRSFNQEQLDDQYNVRGGIPDYLDIFARWKENSARFRNDNSYKANLAYGNADLQRMDFFPAKDPQRPLLVFIHGGYWQSLDKSDFSFLAKPYLEQNINVAIVNYRLAPLVGMTEIVKDNQDAVVWLYQNAEFLGFDKDSMFLSGHSAGGHLTATLANSDWGSLGIPSDVLKGGCAISGLYDLEPIRLCYLNKVIGMNEDDVAKFSPSRMTIGATPLILTVGGAESAEYFRLQADYAARLHKSGRLISVIDLKRGHHFDAVEELGLTGGALSQAVLKMIVRS